MMLLVWTFALLAAMLHVVVFVWEALLFQRPGVHQRIFLFLGSGAVAGVISWSAGNETVGRTLVIYTCLFMFLSGLVLLIADRLELGRARDIGPRWSAGPERATARRAHRRGAVNGSCEVCR